MFNRKVNMNVLLRLTNLIIFGQFSFGLPLEKGAISLEDNIHASLHYIRRRSTTRHQGRHPEIAFQATLSKLSDTFDVKESIKFNHLITNIGDAFDVKTGVFTAPVSGLYNFNTNVVADKGNYVEASILVNGKATVSAVSDHRDMQNDVWDQGNAAALLSLSRGDEVSVSVLWPLGSHKIHGIGKSSFSGYLLRSHEHYYRFRRRRNSSYHHNNK